MKPDPVFNEDLREFMDGLSDIQQTRMSDLILLKVAYDLLIHALNPNLPPEQIQVAVGTVLNLIGHHKDFLREIIDDDSMATPRILETAKMLHDVSMLVNMTLSIGTKMDDLVKVFMEGSIIDFNNEWRME